MKTHELAKILLKRPNGELTISIDISTGEHDAFDRAQGDECTGWQEDTNPEDTVLLFNGKATVSPVRLDDFF